MEPAGKWKVKSSQRKAVEKAFWKKLVWAKFGTNKLIFSPVFGLNLDSTAQTKLGQDPAAISGLN